MAEKTFPSLPEISTIAATALFAVDTGIETFKIKGDNLALFIADQILPAGLVVPFAGDLAPSGWLLIDGTAVSRTTYARLFAAIGTTYGTGDGSTTFNLPDGRGRVIAGKDNMGGSTAGRITNAGSGIVGTTLGATGGSQSLTPTGTIGGTQSIAHVHNIAHAHAYMSFTNSSDAFRTQYTLDDSITSFSGASAISGRSVSYDGLNVVSALQTLLASDFTLYTSGVLSPPTGANGSTAASDAMSTNSTVNGSSFSYTGDLHTNVQPTIVMNHIIKV